MGGYQARPARGRRNTTLTSAVPDPADQHPRVGVEAPDAELPDQHGQLVRLSSFRGISPVVVVFFPFAFTGVCTHELTTLRDAGPRFCGDEATPRARLVAISCDPMFALRVFADQERLEFPLLSDFWPHGAVARRYGVFDEERGCARRGTFILDGDGIVRWTVERPIPEARDVEDYIRVVHDLTAGSAADEDRAGSSAANR